MLYYYLGYYHSKLGDDKNALLYFKTASAKPHDYCFVFRTESIDVLNLAMKMNPADAKAPYYLGNMYYEETSQKAIELWEKSRSIDNSFYIVHRNLAQAYEEIQSDIQKAMASMEKAVECNSNDPRLLFEMDNLYEKNKAASDKKYSLLKKNYETVKKRTESFLRLATRSVEVGRYDEALDILLNNEFPQFEGAREMQDTYLDAYTLRGLKYFADKKFDKALKDFEAALAYPLDRWGRSRLAQFNYLMAAYFEADGNNQKAKEYYQNCIDAVVDKRGEDEEFNFYRGLSLKKLGKDSESKKLFEEMLSNAQSEKDDAFFRQFEGGLTKDQQAASKHYLAGLAFEGMGQKDKAKTEFSKALELNPGHVWSKYHLLAL